MNERYFIGVDVGSRSVRAALFDHKGSFLQHYTNDITVYNPSFEFYEQSSDEIWNAVCVAVKKVTSTIKDKTTICGIGFDATCSLVVLDEHFLPVTVNGDNVEGDDSQNIIMWMDHRAKEQTNRINATNHSILKYVGNKVSLEMQMPKLLWLKENLPCTWKRAKHFIDLPDFLTMKATNNHSRSMCSLVCKWNYKCDKVQHGWDESFLKQIGLEDLIQHNYSRIGNQVLMPGDKCGTLSNSSAIAMGLTPGTSVATSLIDAHAGCLGMIVESDLPVNSITSKLALICGTSTCHMSNSSEAVFVPGVWGPYNNAILPGYWLNEGGQSATGALVDHVIKNHPASNLCPRKDKYEWLEDILIKMMERKDLDSEDFLTEDIHVYPDYHGNRSPLANSDMNGMICGLTLDSSEENLALVYLATIQALAYGTRDIIDQLKSSGIVIGSVYMCGGLSNSKLFIKTHANALGLPIKIPVMQQSVLLGSAMLGAAASTQEGLLNCAKRMSSPTTSYAPEESVKRFHDKKYKIFKMMQSQQLKYRNIMKEAD